MSFSKGAVVGAAITMHLVTGCTRCQCEREQTYALSLAEDDTEEAAVIDIEKCQIKDRSRCIFGKANGQTYQFGFNSNPGVLTGTIGKEKHELYLVKEKVESYGNGILELPFINNDTGVIVIVTWNSKKKKFIGHNFSNVRSEK